MDREYQAKTWKKQDHVVANLGTVEEVKPHIDTLVKGLERVKSL
jgi:dephospho-CoA kinase